MSIVIFGEMFSMNHHNMIISAGTTVTRGLMQASVSGIMVARNIIEKNELI